MIDTVLRTVHVDGAVFCITGGDAVETSPVFFQVILWVLKIFESLLPGSLKEVQLRGASSRAVTPTKVMLQTVKKNVNLHPTDNG